MVYKEIDIYYSYYKPLRKRYLLTLFRNDFETIPEIEKLSSVIEKALEEPFVSNIQNIKITI